MIFVWVISPTNIHEYLQHFFFRSLCPQDNLHQLIKSICLLQFLQSHQLFIAKLSSIFPILTLLQWVKSLFKRAYLNQIRCTFHLAILSNQPRFFRFRNRLKAHYDITQILCQLKDHILTQNFRGFTLRKFRLYIPQFVLLCLKILVRNRYKRFLKRLHI